MAMKGYGKKLSASVLFLIIFFNASAMANASSGDLRVGFYGKTCPSAEAIVRKAVRKAVSWNPGVAAGLIRMHFHDCFVRGCDASILLDSTPDNASEKEHPANRGLRGFEVIDEAKAEIEAACPKTVSCADILAFAARDSALLVGGINYAVPSGRHDGRISKVDEPTGNLPPPFLDVVQLEKSFARKGLSSDEMVTLSGAHSIGISHCAFFSKRLYNFSTTHDEDPSIAPLFANQLRIMCPKQTSKIGVDQSDPIVALDVITPNQLDNVYYKNIINNIGLLSTDQTLMSNPSTAKLVWKYAKRGQLWAGKFAAAMARMGDIEVLTGQHGEIRRNCRAVN